MKRLYKNTLSSRVSSYTLRVIALLCVLLGVSSSAWGETGFHEEEGKALSLRINDSSWYDFGIDGHTGVNNLGNYLPGECPQLNEFYYRTYKKDDNVCQKGYILVYRNSTEKSWGSTNSVAEIGSNDGYFYQRWSGETFNNILPTTPGSYSFDLYVKARVGNCEANEEYWIWLNNGNQNYKFSYNVVKTIYLTGSGAVGKWDNYFEPAEPTDDINIVRFKLKAIDQEFRFSDQASENWTFFRNTAKYDNSKDEGANLDRNMNGSDLQSLTAQISSENQGKGYSEPVYFYYNTSTNKYWVKASQKASYAIEFEDQSLPVLSCMGIDKGQTCVHSIDLGEGTYRFKIKKNDAPYYYGTPIANSIEAKNLTAGDKYTTLTVNKYGTCTFTLQESGNNFTLKVAYTELKEPVLLTYAPQLSSDNKSATLSAYLQLNLCNANDINQYGFVICPGGSTSACVPTETSTRIGCKTSCAPINRGSEIKHTTGISEDNLIGGITYGYRAYVIIDGKMYLSRETGTFRLDDDCVPQAIKGPNAVSKVVYTVDASLGEDYANDCKLIYGNLQAAIDALRATKDNEEEEGAYQYVKWSSDGGHESYNLQVPVEINVRYYDNTPDDNSSAYIYRGTTEVGNYAGSHKPENANLLKDFNRNGADAEHTLTIKAGNSIAKPWIHHIVIRNSKNIVLDSLAIFSDPVDYDAEKEGVQTKGDNAIEIDVNSTGWNSLTVGACEEANIQIQNCIIGSDGFTGIHVSAYDGVTFKNNDFEAIFTSAEPNDINWGASAKFIACKNIKFVQNNFRGDHATLMWLQETQNVLLMNNVFWNTNNYVAAAETETPTAIRLVAQYAKNVQNVGCYYNTFYLAENAGKTTAYKYNFLQFSNSPDPNGGGSANNFIDGTIEFKYNNCYSYAENCKGKDLDPFLGKEANNTLCPNNFWSEYDQIKYNKLTEDKKASYVSDFAFGKCDNKFINVKQQVCSTTATGPSSLIVKGSAMNLGSAPDVETITKLSLEDNEKLADRYLVGIRPNDPKATTWTYGAYQSREAIPTDVIYWVGLSEDWDDRNNWEYETRQNPEDEESPMIRQRVSCVNTFSKNLKVVIEEIGSIEVSGGRKWPNIPQFNGTRKNSKYGEHVNAGLGVPDHTPTEFAHSIEVEYGAAIKGIENLKDNSNVYYSSATTNFVANRSQWILVGPVVEPFKNGTTDPVRSVVSGDYFLNHVPQVYMHKAVIEGGVATWKEPFPDLNVPIEPQEVFAINVPDEYGIACIPAAYYYDETLFPSRSDRSKLQDGTEPKAIPPFTGRFVNHKAMPQYTINGATLVSNTYPCNLSAKAIEDKTDFKVSYYDYSAGSFKPLGGTDVLIKPQHGFALENNGTLTIDHDMLADGNTRSRSAERVQPAFTLGLYNAGNTQKMSEIIVRYDAEHTPGVAHNMDTKKVFAPNEDTPDLYMLMYNDEYARIHTPKAEQTIALGVELSKLMSVKFAVIDNNQFSQITLLDKQTGKEYNLLEETFTAELLPEGTTEGRFYLNLSVEGEYDSDQDANDEVTTDVAIIDKETASINIITNNSTLRVIGTNTELNTIYVSDMSGRTMRYDVSGNYVNVNMPVNKGIYLVQVIGDNATRTEKVVIK